jgi:hypothetical protein
MQVFMPYPDLQRSVCCLDTRRLGNQVYREAKTIIIGGWHSHPVTKIWANHKYALAQYSLEGLEELRKRGRYYPKWYEFFTNYLLTEPLTGLPPIIGYEPFHAGHRAALLAKGLMDTTWKMAQDASQCPVYLRVCPKRDWTWEDTQEVCNLLDGPPETWYSQFGWTEPPEPDPKKSYIWTLPQPGAS